MHILSEVGASLVTLAEQGFKITVVGHSLGGAVASLVTYLFRSISIHALCYAYGSPCCVDSMTSDGMKDYVTTVVLHDDLIARITPASIRSPLFPPTR
jgi:putative lipase involved disintegration of autophagic bodies